jgi:hypothetical protein
MVSFSPQVVEAGISSSVRIKTPKQKTAAGKPMLKAVTQQSEDPAADMDDEVPFLKNRRMRL